MSCDYNSPRLRQHWVIFIGAYFHRKVTGWGNAVKPQLLLIFLSLICSLIDGGDGWDLNPQSYRLPCLSVWVVGQDCWIDAKVAVAAMAMRIFQMAIWSHDMLECKDFCCCCHRVSCLNINAVPTGGATIHQQPLRHGWVRRWNRRWCHSALMYIHRVVQSLHANCPC